MGGSGSSAGLFDKPVGIALDGQRGRVYVGDRGNFRIQVNETTVGTPSLDSGYYRVTLPSGTWAVNVEATGYSFPPGQTVTVLAFNETFEPLFVTASTPSVPGDTDGDLDVDGADLSVMAVEFGLCTADCRADFEPDGDVDIRDLQELAGTWGGYPRKRDPASRRGRLPNERRRAGLRDLHPDYGPPGQVWVPFMSSTISLVERPLA